MGRKLFVGNLAYGVTDGDLMQLFAESGAVQSAKVINDRETGRSKGFGFVEMDNDNDAQEAIKRFNGLDFKGRKMAVNEARPQGEGGGGGHRGNGGGGGGGNRFNQGKRFSRGRDTNDFSQW